MGEKYEKFKVLITKNKVEDFFFFLLAKTQNLL